MEGRTRRAFVPIAGLHHAGRRARGRLLRLQRHRRRGRDVEARARAFAHRVCRHRRAPRRRRVLRFRGRSGPDLRRYPRGRALPVSRHRRCRRDRYGRRHRLQAQPAVAAGRRRCRVPGRLAGHRVPSRAASARVRDPPVRRRQPCRRPDHAPAVHRGRARPRGDAPVLDRRPTCVGPASSGSAAAATTGATSRAPGPAWSRLSSRRPEAGASGRLRPLRFRAQTREIPMFAPDMRIAEFDPRLAAAISAERRRAGRAPRADRLGELREPARAGGAGHACSPTSTPRAIPGKRYYGGCEFVDVVEQLAIDRAKQLFGAELRQRAAALRLAGQPGGVLRAARSPATRSSA